MCKYAKAGLSKVFIVAMLYLIILCKLYKYK
jgi:hypothetical protein